MVYLDLLLLTTCCLIVVDVTAQSRKTGNVPDTSYEPVSSSRNDPCFPNFECANGQCIDRNVICDGRRNCRDGSDETQTLCYPKGRVTTSTTERDLGFHPLSNRPSNPASSYECAQDEFHCLSGECIDRRKLCNRQRDCDDNSDESASNCPVNTNNRANPSSGSSNKPPKASCTLGDFMCISGECVGKGLVCDGHIDCVDGTDETYSLCPQLRASNDVKTSPRNQKEQEIRQEGQVRPSQSPPTIPIPQPVAPFECRTGEFSCTSGECVSKELTCDGVNDCKDASDEAKSLCAKVQNINVNHNSDNEPNQYYEMTVESNHGGSGRPLQRPNQGTQNGGGFNSGSSQHNNGAVVNDANGNAANSWHTKLTPCRVPQQPPNGRWRLHRSLCDPGSNRECEAPPQLWQMEPGSYLVYTCNDGFVLNGSRDVLCGPGGRWIHEPKCDEIKCPDLSSSTREAVCQLNRQHVSCEIPASVGTDAKLKCRNGFVKEPSYEATFANVTCGIDGTWKPAPIQCHKKPKRVKLVVQGDIVIEDE